MKVRLTPIKLTINRLIKPFNLRFETLTLHNLELKRLNSLESKGQFEKPIFPIPKSFHSSIHCEILEELEKYSDRFADFSTKDRNDVGYSFDNIYFTNSDAEVLYTIIRKYKPKNIIEIGSGNSSLITRQAIIDENLETNFTSIDPNPRVGIENIVDKSIKSYVEEVGADFFNVIQSGDILFIDSSHEIKEGNDVVFLFLEVLPRLPKGVIIHVHDIFLPYEYPRDWVIDKMWSFKEQYLLQSILYYSNNFEVLWPGYYLQKNFEKFSDYFPNMENKTAKSFWFKKLS